MLITEKPEKIANMLSFWQMDLGKGKTKVRQLQQQVDNNVTTITYKKQSILKLSLILFT